MMAAMRDELERQAIEWARDGERVGTRFLYLRYERTVDRSVRDLVPDERAAEEVTNAVFAGLPEALLRYDPSEGPFLEWICELARGYAGERPVRRARPARRTGAPRRAIGAAPS
jgi:hypothetical protein